jgi:hypothetical protein
MAKKKTDFIADHVEAEDGMLGAMCERMARDLGSDRIRSQDEIVRRLVGLPMPGLAMRYLLQQDVFPLGRIATINGIHESCKSSLMFEIMRWHMIYGGLSMLIENESKDSPDIREGVWDHDDDLLNRKFRVVQTISVEEWQSALTRAIEAATAFCTKAGGPGRAIPCVYGIDSLSGKASEEDFAKVAKEGHAQRGFSTVALHTTKYLQTLPSWLIDWPFSIIGIQHLKKAQDPRTGAVIRNKPGGKAISFMETFEFEMVRIRDVKKIDEGGVQLSIETRKNSLGPSRIKIQVVFRWWWETIPETGARVQKFAFDWDDASMGLLVAQAKDKKTVWNRIREIVDLHPLLSKRRVWSRTLGIPEDSPASFAEAYRILESEHPELLPELYGLLGIRRRRPFVYGQDYLTMTSAEDAIVPTGPPEPTLYTELRNVGDDIAETLSLAGAVELTPEITEEAALDPATIDSLDL